MTSDKGCVPHDLLSKSSGLNILYNSDIFKSFIRKVLNLDKIFPYADNLSSINLNYYQKGQQLGWHFDNASFAITLMIQSSTLGGEFEYITEGRDSNANYIDKKLISDVIEGKSNAKLLDVSEGTLILFYGRNYLHRVTPVQSDTPRILITLNYNEENHIELSENARLTFFGRVN
jgi:predicted 2-oxoglutarate/Fe(II)-dependent dioxygenase YbiX